MKIIFAVLLLSHFFVPFAYSQTMTGQDPYHFSLYYAQADFDYKEPGLMSLAGTLKGFGSNFQYRDRVFATLEIESLKGDTQYHGQTQDGVPADTTTQDRITNLRLHFGVPVVQYSQFIVVPYLGMGIREWDDKINGPGGYRREIVYVYAPIGLMSEFNLTTYLTFFADAEYDYFINGTVRSFLGDFDPSFPTAENQQKKGHGQRYGGGAALIFKNFFFRVQYFLREWKIKQSDTARIQIPVDATTVIIMSVTEPANQTKTSGAMFQLGFTF